MSDARSHLRECFEVGPHKLEQILEDTFCVRWGTDVTYDNMKQVIDLVESLCAKGPIYLLLDMRTTGIPEQRARRMAVQRVKQLGMKCAAVFGAGAAIRAILILMQNVTRLVDPEAAPEMRFFNDEATALAWLLGRRAS